jgi:hypothetical protein
MFFYTILLRFVLKICQKYVIFKVFQIHLQVLLLLKNIGYKSFYIFLKVQIFLK